MNLKNKIVIITGAGSGIGAATAKLFGTHGATVVASDINLEKANTVAEHGRLDVMVNNAGIGGKHQYKTADHTHDDWHNVIAVNQTGVFYCMKVAIKQMLAQGGGSMVNVASLAGLKASGNNLSYSASKFAVVGMTKSCEQICSSRNDKICCFGIRTKKHSD